MPVEIITGIKALSFRNKLSRYPEPKRDPGRLIPYPSIEHCPKFKITTDDNIFTIGSCFARNTERALLAMGLPVLSALIKNIPANENITNKYTTRSIIHDFKATFQNTSTQFNTIYGDDKRGYYNLTFGGTGALKGQDLSIIQNLTERYFENLQKLSQADIVILTLGLVEVWRDKESGEYLNLMPPLHILKAMPDQFELHVLSFEDIVKDLNIIIDTINKTAKSGVRILLTVSPVPLHATFRDQDCLQANMYSKSVQRAATEQICMQFDNVSYFPSYEMVALASPDKAWIETDFRHVRPELVDRIMRHVIEKYIGETAIPPSKPRLQELILKKENTTVINLVESFLNSNNKKIITLPLYVRYYYARALLSIPERSHEAYTILESVVKEAPKHYIAERLLKTRPSSIN